MVMMRNPATLVLIGVCAIFVAIGFNVYTVSDDNSDNLSSSHNRNLSESDLSQGRENISSQNTKSVPKTKPNDTAPTKETIEKKSVKKVPSFDIVRVDPDGNAVIAGRAAPGEKVSIIDNGITIGNAIADNRGEWVSVTKTELGPGSRKLTLESRKEGEAVKKSEVPVVILVPPKRVSSAAAQKDETSALVAIKIPEKGLPSKVLQKPKISDTAYDLTIDTIDYDEMGVLIISGQAPAKSNILAYLNNNFIGKAKVDVENFWLIRPKNPVSPGLYNLRVDQVDRVGKVISRISTPFSRANPQKEMPSEPFIVVQHGNSLWRLAARNYGSGFRYTIILNANREQIKDPDLIYPGQVFALPSSD